MLVAATDASQEGSIQGLWSLRKWPLIRFAEICKSDLVGSAEYAKSARIAPDPVRRNSHGHGLSSHTLLVCLLGLLQLAPQSLCPFCAVVLCGIGCAVCICLCCNTKCTVCSVCAMCTLYLCNLCVLGLALAPQHLCHAVTYLLGTDGSAGASSLSPQGSLMYPNPSVVLAIS